MNSDIKPLLESKLRDDLNIIARKLRIANYRSLRKDDLISSILRCDEQLVRKALSLTWWDHYHNHIYGIATIVALLLTVVFFVIPFLNGPTKENQIEIKDNVNKALNGQNRAEKKWDDFIKRNEEKFKQDELLKEYPLGYMIFATEEKDSLSVIPLRSYKLLDKYDINWSKFRIESSADNQIKLHLNGIKLKGGDEYMEVEVGGPKKVGNLSGFFINELTIFGEILEINQDGIVFLVGFQRNYFKEMDRAREITEKAISRFHFLFNEGEFDNIWNEANPQFQDNTEKLSFDKFMRNRKAELGEFQLTTKDKRSSQSIKGDCVIVDIKQRSIFANKKTVEGFSYEVKGDKASLISWHINSPVPRGRTKITN